MRSNRLTFEIDTDAMARFEKLKSAEGVPLYSIEEILEMGLRDLVEKSARKSHTGRYDLMSDELIKLRHSKESISLILQQTKESLEASIRCRADYNRDSERLIKAIEFYDAAIKDMESKLRLLESRKDVVREGR